jgi:putative effector of murein hydrolase
LGGGGAVIPIAILVCVFSGILGAIFSPYLRRLFKFNALTTGVAMGASSTSIGAAKAVEMGEIEAAVSSVSVVICGLMTAALILVFQAIYPLI